METAREESNGERGNRMTRWLLIGCMFVISAVAYLDPVNISIDGQFLQRDFHLDNTQLGAVFSAFVLGYAPLRNALQRRARGARRLIGTHKQPHSEPHRVRSCARSANLPRSPSPRCAS